MLYMRLPNGKSKALTLSYDDGVVQDKRLVELMNKNGVKGTFNLNGCRYIGNPPAMMREALSACEAKECYDSGGHEIALHSYTHPFLELVPFDNVAYQIAKDREILESAFSRIVKGMAYPMGTTSDSVVDVLKACGVSYARTTKCTESFAMPTDWLRLPATCHHKNPRLMELAKSFAENENKRACQLFYVWGHSYEFDNDNNWDVIENFLSYIGGREDIWYATNIEIFEYVEAYSRLKTSADLKIMHNPTAIDLWAEEAGKLYCIKSGETLYL